MSVPSLHSWTLDPEEAVKVQADLRKRVKLESELSAEGVLTGTAEETYVGFDAAQVREALDAISPDQRDQALQAALSRYFGGAELSSLKLEMQQEVGAPLVVRYSFRAPRFGRLERGKIIIGPLTFPAQLGRRFVEVGSRKTPLYIGDSEGAIASATMKLPAGMHVESMLGQPIQQVTPFGQYSRAEAEKGGVFSVEESYLLRMARIPPKDYDAFATFAGEVDLVQARDVTIAP